MRSIGLDVHKQFAEVAIIDEGKVPKTTFQVPATPSGLAAFARSLRPDDQVVLEATVNTWAVADALSAHAGRVVVSNPLRTKAIASAKVKTDKVDAITLAQLLAADFIPEVWIPDTETRDRRREVAHRATLVRQQTMLRNRIEAALHRNLVECPHADTFGKSGRLWLDSVELPSADRRQVDSVLRQLVLLEDEIALADETIARRGLDDPDVLRLMTIPGVGVQTAAALVAVIGDLSRFPRPNQLVGYLGLDPRVRQSGGKPAFTGHISRQGQAHARGLLVQAAHASVRTPGPLRAFYHRVKERRGTQVAIVAVARKLTVLSWHLLTKSEDYRWAAETRVADKVRATQLKAGSAKLGTGVPGQPRARRSSPLPDGRRPHRSVEWIEQRARDQVREAEAEAEYKRLVASRRRPTATPS
jgi:transposase